MERGAGPKRFRASVERLAGGGTVSEPDVLIDALFLSKHPGWTYQALQDTPYEVIEVMRMLGRAQGRAAQRQQKRSQSGIRKR